MNYLLRDLVRKLPVYFIGLVIIFSLVSSIDHSLFEVIERVSFVKIGGSLLLKLVPLYNLILIYFVTGEFLNLASHYKAEWLIRCQSRTLYCYKRFIVMVFYCVVLTILFVFSWVIFTMIMTKSPEIALSSLLMPSACYFLYSLFFMLLMSNLLLFMSDEKALFTLFIFGFGLIVFDGWNIVFKILAMKVGGLGLPLFFYIISNVVLTSSFFRKGRKMEDYNEN